MNANGAVHPNSPLGQFLSEVGAVVSARDGQQLALLLDPLVDQSAIDPLTPQLSSLDAGALEEAARTFIVQRKNGSHGSSFDPFGSGSGQESGERADVEVQMEMSNVTAAYCRYLATPDMADCFQNLQHVINASARAAANYDWFTPVITTLLQALIVVGRDHETRVGETLRSRAMQTNTMHALKQPPKSSNEIHAVFSKITSRLLMQLQIAQSAARRNGNSGYNGVQQVQSSTLPPAILPVVNIALKFYQSINEQQLSTKVIGQVENVNLPLDSYPISQRVIYHYYVGRIDVSMHDFASAENHLEFAFVHTPRGDTHHKRASLIFLIVVRLLRGVYPDHKLLEKYGLTDIFDKLVIAIQLGSWTKFLLALRKNKPIFSNLGLYFLLQQRIKRIIYRNLLVRTYDIISESSSDNGNHPGKLQLDEFLAACRISGMKDATLFGVESVVIDLIGQGWVKGYIMQDRSLLVLAKRSPFPPLETDIHY